ncbi:MAG: hypothetical protein KDK66_00540 [Deltaproteobacteria bacterium]|nr:hypothetical protein [Deltaproteobacteria bacterium]
MNTSLTLSRFLLWPQKKKALKLPFASPQKNGQKKKSQWMKQIKDAFHEQTPLDWLPSQYQYSLKHLERH